MIIEYNEKYKQDAINLLVELQEHLVALDVEKYNRLTSEYGKLYFEKTLEDVNNFEGKIFLYEENGKILGLVAGHINNDAETTYDMTVPKRGKISELVVSKSARSQGIGDKLISHMERFLQGSGCKDVLLGVFAYNIRAHKFYEKHGYHNRMIIMTKTINKEET